MSVYGGVPFTPFDSAADLSHLKFGVIVAQWNHAITSELYTGTIKTLLNCGVASDQIEKWEVPGTFELTAAASLMATQQINDVIICLGCVIRGETGHYDFICQSVTNGLTQLTVMHNRPFIFGVLTTENLQQAQDRIGGKHGHKGNEAALTAISMALLFRSRKKELPSLQ